MGILQNIFKKNNKNSAQYYTQMTFDQLKEKFENGDTHAAIDYAQRLMVKQKYDEAEAVITPLLNTDFMEAEALAAEIEIHRKKNLSQSDIKQWENKLTSLYQKGCFLAAAYLGQEKSNLNEPTNSCNREAVKWLSKLNGIPREYCLNYVGDCIYAISLLLCGGIGEHFAAFQAAQIGASYNNAFCLCNLGGVYAFASYDFAKKDFDMAEYYFKECIKAKDYPFFESHSTAYLGLARLAAKKEDKAAWINYMQQSAELGMVIAMQELAKAYRVGWGTQKDVAKAAEWEQKAIARGSQVDAQKQFCGYI